MPLPINVLIRKNGVKQWLIWGVRSDISYDSRARHSRIPSLLHCNYGVLLVKLRDRHQNMRDAAMTSNIIGPRHESKNLFMLVCIVVKTCQKWTKIGDQIKCDWLNTQWPNRVAIWSTCSGIIELARDLCLRHNSCELIALHYWLYSIRKIELSYDIQNLNSCIFVQSRLIA
jgi:hypothetical protein